MVMFREEERGRLWLILKILSLTNWLSKKQAKSLKPILEVLLVLKCPKVRDSRKTFLVMQDIGRKISEDDFRNTKFT